jgi:UDP:flavonoid glycosyltransferase YjiC (YdhE family)
VLDPPDNAVVERFVPHAAVLPHAALVVTHAGHGTVLSALRAGVSLVCVPMGRDQHDVAARVSHHGAGISLPAGTEVPELAAGIAAVLADPGYAGAARRLSRAILAEDPDRVVDAVVGAGTAKSSGRRSSGRRSSGRRSSGRGSSGRGSSGRRSSGRRSSGRRSSGSG